jgi:hypothetical protein
MIVETKTDHPEILIFAVSLLSRQISINVHIVYFEIVSKVLLLVSIPRKATANTAMK